MAALRRAGANCADIAGATGSTYTLSAADVGATIRVVVTATNAAGTRPRDLGADRQSSPPRRPSTRAAADDHRHGRATADADRRRRHLDRHADDHLRLPVAALRRAGANCADIAGATGRPTRSTPADVGARIRVVVTATNAAGSATATSRADRRRSPRAAPVEHGAAGDLRHARATARR